MTVLDPAGHVFEHANSDPGRVAVYVGGRAVTYAELAQAVERAALGFAGDVSGALVRIGTTSDLGGIVSLLALHRAGAVPLVGRGPAPPTVVGRAPAAMIVIPTSGSTATPKLVPLTARNVAASVTASRSHLGTGPDDVWLSCLPLQHVGGLSILWRSFEAGGSVWVMERFDEREAAALLAGPVTMASLVPTMLRRILRQAHEFSGLRGVLLGGAAADGQLVAGALAAGMPVLTTYGTTETASQVATVDPGEIEESLGTVGRPLPGMEVSIGDGGEIVVDGPAVFAGYLSEEARRGPHHTGDRGRFDRDGRLVVEGRIDDVIITGGENVSPSRVEAVLESHPGIRSAVVFGLPSEQWGEQVVAVVEADDVSEEAVVDWMRHRVSSPELPRRVAVVALLPRVPSGKVDRRSARSLVGGG